MRPLRLIAGLLIISGSIVLSADALYELVRIGTCGAPAGAIAYRECPAGTGGHILALIAGTFVLPFVGVLLAPVNKAALGVLWWCFLWVAMGSAALVAGYGPSAPEETKGDALGVGITFLAIGVISLLGSLALAFAARRGSARIAQRMKDASAGSDSA